MIVWMRFVCCQCHCYKLNSHLPCLVRHPCLHCFRILTAWHVLTRQLLWDKVPPQGSVSGLPQLLAAAAAEDECTQQPTGANYIAKMQLVGICAGGSNVAILASVNWQLLSFQLENLLPFVLTCT